MNDQERIEFLAKASGLSHESIRQLTDKATYKKIKKKQLLAEPGKLINYSYFLIDGIVRHYILDKNDEQFTKHFMKGPNFVVASIPDFFLRTNDSIYCEAVTDLEVLESKYDDLISFSMDHPKFFHFLLKCVVVVYKQKEQKEINMHILDAKARYYRFLEDFPEVAYEVPLRYIASFLNIRPETLSRIRASK